MELTITRKYFKVKKPLRKPLRHPSSQVTWNTAGGKSLKIMEMSNNHLMNSHKYLNRSSHLDEKIRVYYMGIMEEEMRYRVKEIQYIAEKLNNGAYLELI